MMRQPDVQRGIPLALCAGTLLGAGAPLSKLLVSRMDPVALAGALYTGPALIAALALLLGFSKHGPYVRVTCRDVPRLAVAVLTGTIAAPVLLMYGIRISSGFAASLMLNMEAARTAAFAGVGPLAGALLSLVAFRTPVTWVVVAALGLTAAAVLVVGRDDQRRSLAWETVER